MRELHEPAQHTGNGVEGKGILRGAWIDWSGTATGPEEASEQVR